MTAILVFWLLELWGLADLLSVQSAMLGFWILGVCSRNWIAYNQFKQQKKGGVDQYT